MFKKITIIIAAIILLCLPIYAQASPKPIEIYINNVKLETDVPPIIFNDRTLVPVRAISEHFGCEVFWDNEQRLVRVVAPSKTIVLKIDDTKVLVDEQEITLDVPAKIVKNRTMVPLRFLGETLGAKVSWDNDLRRVLITKSGAKIIDFSYEKIGGKPSIVIKGDNTMDYNLISTDEDNLMAIDVTAHLDTLNNALYTYDSYLDKAVAGEVSSEPPITRVVLYLKSQMFPRVYQSSDKKSVILTFENNLENIEVEKQNNNLLAKLKTTSPTTLNYFFLSNPDRLVVDIDDTILSEIEPLKVPKNDFVKDIRLGQFTENTVRAVFDLKNNINYQVFQDDNDISVIFSEVNTVEDVRTSKNGDMTIVEILASDEIGYELRPDKGKKQLKIVIPGVAVGKNLINQDFIKVDDDIIDSIALAKVKGSKNYTLEVIVNLNTFSSYEMLSSPPSSCIRLGIYKSSLKNKLIAIDPGHGGSEPGAVVGSVKEKDLNLDIGLKLKKLLEESGARVFMIRDDDTFVSHFVRAGMANEVDADVFISIHNNSAGSGASGTETLYFPEPEKKAFATAIQKAMVSNLGLNDRGICERPGIVVTRETKMPSALVEVAFMTNKNDMALLLQDEFRQKVAEALFEGIINYLSGKS